jgi:predicted  nucleic acid-binding Zn-ribbon protein
MPIHNVVSTLPDQEYVRALERELQDLKDRIVILEGAIAEIRKGLT